MFVAFALSSLPLLMAVLRVSLCGPGCSGIHCVPQHTFEYKSTPSASVFLVLALRAGTTMQTLVFCFQLIQSIIISVSGQLETPSIEALPLSVWPLDIFKIADSCRRAQLTVDVGP